MGRGGDKRKELSCLGPCWGQVWGSLGCPRRGCKEGAADREVGKTQSAIKQIIAECFGGVWVGPDPVVHVSGAFAGVGALRAAWCGKAAGQGSPIPKSCCSSWAVTGEDGAWPKATPAVSNTSWGAWELYWPGWILLHGWTLFTPASCHAPATAPSAAVRKPEESGSLRRSSCCAEGPLSLPLLQLPCKTPALSEH